MAWLCENIEGNNIWPKLITNRMKRTNSRPFRGNGCYIIVKVLVLIYSIDVAYGSATVNPKNINLKVPSWTGSATPLQWTFIPGYKFDHSSTNSKNHDFFQSLCVSETLTAHPDFYYGKEGSNKVYVKTKRFHKGCRDGRMIDDASRTIRRHIWVVTGGPGSDPTVLEVPFLLHHLSDTTDAAVYFVGHRGIGCTSGQATAIPHARSLDQTLDRLDTLLANFKIPLSAFGSAMASLDLVFLMDAVNQQSKDAEHYLYGESYGGHVALQAASWTANTAFRSLQPAVKGMIVDSGLAPDHFVKGTLAGLHRLGEVLVADCANSWFCRRVTNPDYLYRGIQALQANQKTLGDSANPFLISYATEFAYGSNNLLGMTQAIFQVLFEQEYITLVLFDSSSATTDATVFDHLYATSLKRRDSCELDTRVLILQLLHSFGCTKEEEWKDRSRFNLLLRLLGAILVTIYDGAVRDGLAVTYGQSPTSALAKRHESGIPRKLTSPIFVDLGIDLQDFLRSIQPYVESFEADFSSPLSFAMIRPFNDLLYLSIIFSEFWDYTPPTIASLSTQKAKYGLHLQTTDWKKAPAWWWKDILPDNLTALGLLAERFRSHCPNAIPGPQPPGPDSPIQFLFLTGGLDAHTPSSHLHTFALKIGRADRRLIVNVPTCGHVLGIGKCREEALLGRIKSFLAGKNDDKTTGLVTIAMSKTLDWNQNEPARLGLFTWNSSQMSLWLTIASTFMHFKHACPVSWLLIPLSFAIIIAGFAGFLYWFFFLYDRRKSREACIEIGGIKTSNVK